MEKNKHDIYHMPYHMAHVTFFWGGSFPCWQSLSSGEKLTTSWLNPDNIKEYHFDAGEEKTTTTFYSNFNHKWQILLKWSEAAISVWKYQSALFPGALIISHLAHLAILLLLTFPCLLSPNWIISFSYFQIHKEPSTTKLSSKIITWLCLYFVQGF